MKTKIVFLLFCLLSRTVFAGNANSLSLSGNAYASIPHFSGFDFSDSFTIEAWFRLSSLPEPGVFATIVSKGANDDMHAVKQSNFYLGISNNSLSTNGRNLVFGFENTAGVNISVAYPFTHQVGEWYHAAGVFNIFTKTLLLYQNGVQVAQLTNIVDRVARNAEIITIGRLYSDQKGHQFQGQIDELRLWAHHRSPAEIQANYNTEIKSTEYGLVGYWRFNASVSDSSRFKTNVITLHMGAGWSTDIPFESIPIPCPPGSVSLASNELLLGESTFASVPVEFSDGTFQSSNVSVATVTGRSVKGLEEGQSQILGTGWNHSNGATNCTLSAATVSVSRHFLSKVTHGPVVGAVTTTAAKVWVRLDHPAKVSVTYRKLGEGNFVTTATVGSGVGGIAVVLLTKLSPKTTYEYKVSVNGVEQSKDNTFQTFPAGASRFSFAVGADLDYTFAPHSIVSEIKKRNPQFLLLIGDQIYADTPRISSELEEYRLRYRENWAESNMAALFGSIPVYFMWDDHDIRNDWNLGTKPPYPNARQAFDEYSASVNPDPRNPGDLYYSFDAGETSFYVMDVRSFRDKTTMLGAQQKADLKSWLLSSKAKFKFIVSSVIFSLYGTTQNDSWLGFQTERTELLDFIRDNNIHGVVILSGDQHWTMVSRMVHGSAVLYEFQATPMSSQVRETTRSSSPEILFKSFGSMNYGFFEIDTTVSPATLSYKNYAAKGDVLYELRINENNFDASVSNQIK